MVSETTSWTGQAWSTEEAAKAWKTHRYNVIKAISAGLIPAARKNRRGEWELPAFSDAPATWGTIEGILEGYVTAAEAARLWGSNITAATLRQLIESGQMPGSLEHPPYVLVSIKDGIPPEPPRRGSSYPPGMAPISAKAEEWGVSVQRVSLLCRQGRIPGAERLPQGWAIPDGAAKPAQTPASPRRAKGAGRKPVLPETVQVAVRLPSAQADRLKRDPMGLSECVRQAVAAWLERRDAEESR